MDRDVFNHIFALAEHFAFITTGQTMADKGTPEWLTDFNKAFDDIAKSLGYYRDGVGGWEHPALV